jgi:hypothetical protein
MFIHHNLVRNSWVKFIHENLTLNCMKETPVEIQDTISRTFLKLETRCFLAAKRTKGSFITLNWQIAKLFLFFYRIFKLIKHIINDHIISFLLQINRNSTIQLLYTKWFNICYHIIKKFGSHYMQTSLVKL